MTVEFKDYYQVTRAPPEATNEEIKKDFRTLARMYHPDVAKDKKTAEEKYKEFNEAHEVLSNPESRKKRVSYAQRIQVPPHSGNEEERVWRQLAALSAFDPRKTG